MTLQELITDLKAAGANENTVRLAMNCYELGAKEMRDEIVYTWLPAQTVQTAVDDELHRLADEIAKMPFGDTAASFAVWVRNGGQA